MRATALIERDDAVVVRRAPAPAPHPVLNLQRAAGNQATAAMIARQRSVDDLKPVGGKLYFANRKYTGGQTAGDAVTGRHLHNWAVSSGGAILRSDAAIKQLQENPNAVATIVADTYLELVERLRGPEFDGTTDAREKAVVELGERWAPIEAFLTATLKSVYMRGLTDALARTPRGATLVTKPSEIRRLRTSPHGHTTEDDRWGGTVKVGERRGSMWIVDIEKREAPTPRERWKAINPGTLWFHLDGHPLWYYERSSNLRDAHAFVSEVSRQVADNTQFAAELLPLMIKGMSIGAGFVGGFGPTLAARIAIDIASAALDELGEEGLRDARGQKGRDGWEILKSAGLSVLMSRVMDAAYNPRASAPRGVTANFERKAAAAVRKNVVEAEQGEVLTALKSGKSTRVEDPARRAQGFDTEVHIVADGQPHTYRRKPDTDTWCRWSETPMCGLDLGLEVKRERANARKPKAGESAEEWLDRTQPEWRHETEAIRKMKVRDAPHKMADARLEAAVLDPNTIYEHYLTAGGYVEIMRGSSLRAGEGVGNYGGGGAVRAYPRDLKNTAAAGTDMTFIEFRTPFLPEPQQYISGTYARWKMPAGDFLKIDIVRVRYRNGAIATRLPQSTVGRWKLQVGSQSRVMGLDDLLRLGETPTL